MKYGFFDAANREYVVTRPDTPQPWANYLGSPAYGAIISNNAAGYSFVRSGADGRLIRYRFNELNTNLPGRYIYIRDDKTGDYWTNSWQPTAKPFDEFKSECRHGTAYTVIKSEYKGILSEVTYYVPLNCQREVWRVKITNTGGAARELSAFSYAEFTNLGNYEQDTVNLQYSMFISNTEYKNNAIVQHLNQNTTYDEGKTFGSHRFLAAAGTDIVDYCGDREVFFGSYRNYGNPEAVEKGAAGGAHAYNGNAVGVLQTQFTIEPGETKTFCYILGEGNFDRAEAWVKEYADPKKVLLHVPNWRNYGYDEYYPEYTPSADAVKLFEYGHKLGFHIMPHGNSVDMDPTHESYALFRDFEYIDIETRERHGWGWSDGKYLGVPSSNLNLTKNRHNKVMIKVHPASRMWRSVLWEALNGAAKSLNTDAVFIDVTLCTQNIHNCLLDGETPTEGMNGLIRHIASVNGGAAVGGEGLNEITFQGLSFAQAHLFNSHHVSAEGLERTGGINLNDFLFGDLCKTIGYTRLSGKTEDERLRMKIHEEHGAIPTVTLSAKDLQDPNPAMLEVFSKTRD